MRLTKWLILVSFLLVMVSTVLTAITVAGLIDNNGGLKAVVERVWEGKQ